MNQANMKNRASQTYPSRSLHGSIVHELGKRIVRGFYPSGSTLPVEEVLREELQVSRNALREAVKVLSGKGLLKVKTRTGTQVQSRENWHLTDPDVLSWALNGQLDKDVITWLTEFRKVIEPAMAEMAAVRASDEDRDRIRRSLEELEVANAQMERGELSMETFIEFDMAFHESIFDASGNPFLQSVLANISGALMKSRTLTEAVPGARSRAWPAHRKVGRAVIEGRSAEARSAMVELCESIAEDVGEAFNQAK